MNNKKLVELSELKKILTDLKNKTIVFTNGCFDILHAGHVSYLKQASELGDIFVMAINSDASVKRLKGSKRPIFNQSDRAKVLSALKFVDYICIFNEDTPFETLKFLHPNIDILAKGGDYKIENIIGRELVKKVEVIPFVDNKSTTNIIERLLENVKNIWN